MGFQAPESLSEQIAQHLGHRIVTGELQPGDRIQELRIAGELNVSRGSVREALLILERRHLVSIFPRKGAIVSDLTPSIVNSLYDIYIDLLKMLVRRLVEVSENADLLPVINQIRKVDQIIDQGDAQTAELMGAGFEVMRMAYRLVDNPFLEETLENFRPAISRTYHLALEQGSSEFSETRVFFGRLANAASEGDPVALEQAVEQFGERQRSRVLEALNGQGEIDGRPPGRASGKSTSQNRP